MTARDSRLDAGVKVTPKRRWLVGEDQWPDALSLLDVLDSRPTVDEALTPPARPVRVDSPPQAWERVILDKPPTMYRPMMAVLGFGIACFILGGLAVYAVHLMVVAS